jgi:hypothetical protein
LCLRHDVRFGLLLCPSFLVKRIPHASSIILSKPQNTCQEDTLYNLR